MAAKRRGYMKRKRYLAKVRPGAVVIAVMVIAVMLWRFGDLERHAEQSATAETVDVVRVIDGDTLIVQRDDAEERVRLLGVDAPEVARGGEPGEACAPEATALTEELTRTGTVELTPDDAQPETDRYGRTLAYVEADGQDVSAALLQEGLAELYHSAPDIARYGEYERLAEDAPAPSCAR